MVKFIFVTDFSISDWADKVGADVGQQISSQFRQLLTTVQMPQYGWNTVNVGIKHQSINQSINHCTININYYWKVNNIKKK
jgi:hypothetical protein